MVRSLALATALWLGCTSAEPCGQRCPTEVGEECSGCFAKLAECCYGGRELHAQQLSYAQPVCEADPGCVACCNECAALSCEELVANHNCPAVIE